MLINTKVRLGDPAGPLVEVVEDSEGKLYFLESIDLPSATTIYSESGELLTGIRRRATSEKATFYESRSEQQVLTEDGPSGPYDFGWRAKHLGWLVNFEAGTVLYGELASVNQNRQNVGIEGPTAIDGTNGSPSTLFQNVNVSNRPTQVNGWKSFDSPTAYVVDATDIQQVDTAFIYADAFVSWAADSATVTAPGSDMNGLVEYPPTNSIVYTDFT